MRIFLVLLVPLFACGKPDTSAADATNTATSVDTSAASPAAAPAPTATATAIATATATGTSTATATGTTTATATDLPAILQNKVKLTLFGKSIYVADNLYDLSCNQFEIAFWINATVPNCNAVTVTTTPTGTLDTLEDIWTVKSPDGNVNFVGDNFYNANTQVKIGGTNYYCLHMSGEIYKKDGSQDFTAYIIFSQKGAAKASEIDPAQVIGIGANDSSLCNDRF